MYILDSELRKNVKVVQRSWIQECDIKTLF